MTRLDPQTTVRFRGITDMGEVIWEQALDADSDVGTASHAARDQAEAYVAEHGGRVFVQAMDPEGDALPKGVWMTGWVVGEIGASS